MPSSTNNDTVGDASGGNSIANFQSGAVTSSAADVDVSTSQMQQQPAAPSANDQKKNSHHRVLRFLSKRPRPPINVSMEGQPPPAGASTCAVPPTTLVTGPIAAAAQARVITHTDAPRPGAYSGAVGVDYYRVSSAPIPLESEDDEEQQAQGALTYDQEELVTTDAAILSSTQSSQVDGPLLEANLVEELELVVAEPLAQGNIPTVDEELHVENEQEDLRHCCSRKLGCVELWKAAISLSLAVVAGIILSIVLPSREEGTPPPSREELIKAAAVEQFGNTSAFGDKYSPQSQAVRWIDEEEVLEFPLATDANRRRFLNRYVLAVLAYSTDAHNEHWYDSKFWLMPSDECDSWGGIICTADGHGVIEAIKLDHVGLRGQLPAELSGLSDLQILRTNDNTFLRGTIPSELGMLSNLEYLMMSNCGLQGSIPSHLGNLANLSYLSLNDNSLKGDMPSDICRLRSASLTALLVDCPCEVKCSSPSCCTLCTSDSC